MAHQARVVEGQAGLSQSKGWQPVSPPVRLGHVNTPNPMKCAQLWWGDACLIFSTVSQKMPSEDEPRLAGFRVLSFCNDLLSLGLDSVSYIWWQELLGVL